MELLFSEIVTMLSIFGKAGVLGLEMNLGPPGKPA